MKIKVLSFNVQNGYTAGYDYALLGKDIAEEHADLVGLQELDRFTKRNGNRDALSEIAAEAGYEYFAFAHAIDYSDGEYGTGILSRYPIKHFDVLPMESHGDEGRSAGIATIMIDGKEFFYVNTHLSLGAKEMRREQFEALAAIVAGKSYYIITGDFNTEDYSEFVPIKGGNLMNCEKNKLLSWAGEAIDNIVTSEMLTLQSSFIRNEVVHSDHYMIGAVYEIK